MTFDELKLVMAIRKLNPSGADRWSRQDRLDLSIDIVREWIRLFEECRFPFDLDAVQRWVLNFRKSGDNKTKADIALAHGYRCFWDGRGKGPCNDEAEAGHLVPASQDGPLSVENCIIECQRHNGERGATTVEEYLRRP